MKSKSVKRPAAASGRVSSKHIIILYGLIGLLTVALSVTAYFLHWTWWASARSDNANIREMIKLASESLYREMPVDPKERKLYAHEASLRFPVPSGIDRYIYAYNPANEAGQDYPGSAEVLYVGTAQTLRHGYIGMMSAQMDPTVPASKSLEAMFAKIPDYQRCPQQFAIRFTPGDDDKPDFEPASQRALADGRTMYLHRNKGCEAFYANNAIDMDALQRDLERAESY
jgi:hypothetical protein